jgi:hypothetical protein
MGLRDIPLPVMVMCSVKKVQGANVFKVMLPQG